MIIDGNLTGNGSRGIVTLSAWAFLGLSVVMMVLI
jgi:hypothetical protein